MAQVIRKFQFLTDILGFYQIEHQSIALKIIGAFYFKLENILFAENLKTGSVAK